MLTCQNLQKPNKLLCNKIYGDQNFFLFLLDKVFVEVGELKKKKKKGATKKVRKQNILTIIKEKTIKPKLT